MRDVHSIVGILIVEMSIPGCRSLKEKRKALNSLKERVRNNFNVSVSEIDKQDAWQRAVLGISAIGPDKGLVESLLSKIINFVRDFRMAELVDYKIELL